MNPTTPSPANVLRPRFVWGRRSQPGARTAGNALLLVTLVGAWLLPVSAEAGRKPRRWQRTQGSSVQVLDRSNIVWGSKVVWGATTAASARNIVWGSLTTVTGSNAANGTRLGATGR